MRNLLGNSFTLTLFGESHSEFIGVTLDGVPAGFKINYDHINKMLERRRPTAWETPRVENDEYKIISGVFNDYTTGGPLTIVIKNSNVDSSNYNENKFLARPGHVDYVAHTRYRGYEDYRGGGHFSGRITAPIVAAGAICIDLLSSKGIYLASHLLQVYNIKESSFDSFNMLNQILQLLNSDFPSLDGKQQEVNDLLKSLKEKHESCGGIIETGIAGMPVGVGEPWFDSIESAISKAVFAIGGVKGIEFGDGFNYINSLGTEVFDEYEQVRGKIITKSNHNGGINGGLSNGMPIVFKTIMKPTPTVPGTYDSINMNTLKNEELTVKGRHDPCIARRACVVVDALTAITLIDLLMIRFGQEYFM